MTPARFHRLEAVLDRRQPDLTVVLDNVHKPHNLSAILRTCDAVGVFEAHAVWPDERIRPRTHVSASAGKWVRVRTHRTIDEAIASLHDDGLAVVAAHPEPGAVDFRDVDFTRPSALLLGAELEGVSARGIERADHHVVIPMMGLIHSLNVSVAAAVILFEAARQRGAAGLYDRPRLPSAIRDDTLFEWAQPEVAAWCRRHAVPYPPLDEDGEVVGDFRGAAATGSRERAR